MLYPDNKVSMAVEFGCNPGLESIFAKIALLFLAQNHTPKSKELTLYIKNRSFNMIAELLGVELCLCTETDSSKFIDSSNGKFNNTWCCKAFVEEAFEASCEFAYGSNQKTIPKGAELLDDNIIDLHKKPSEIYCEGFVPYDGVMVGCVIPHGENVSLCTFLRNGLYCPTIHYVYRYSPLAYESIKNKRSLNNSHVANNYDDNFKGIDRVGCLVCTKNKSVWCGSILSNDDIKYNSGTTQQVSSAVLSCLAYLLNKPDKEILFPEQIDENFIMSLAMPYLGEIYCDFVDYHPKSLQFKDMQRTKKQFDEQFKYL
jgi:homospermidine synthase